MNKPVVDKKYSMQGYMVVKVVEVTKDSVKMTDYRNRVYSTTVAEFQLQFNSI